MPKTATARRLVAATLPPAGERHHEDVMALRSRRLQIVRILAPAMIFSSCGGLGNPWFDADDPLGSGLLPTFIEEFNSYSASPQFSSATRWSNLPWWNNPYTVPDKSYVHDGVLVLEVARENGNWQFGHLSSYNQGKGWTQKYGYFEARIKMPKGGPGATPAWWLLGQEWVDTGTHGATEIDIVEFYGDRPTAWNANLYEDGQTSDRSVQSEFGDQFIMHQTGVDLTENFHRYGMLWDPNSADIIWYFDGEPVQRAPKYASTDSTPMVLILDNKAILREDLEVISPNFMYVDYVRVYQFPGEQNAGTCVGDCPVATLPAASGDR